MERYSSQKILFYDGYCGLCNTSVNWVLKKDSNQEFKYAPLQGNYASTHIPKEFEVADSKTILYWDGKQIHTKSTAVLHILKELPWLWKLLYIFIFIPRPARDMVYDFISKNRFRWFGKLDTCGIQQPNQAHLFLT